MEYNKEQILRLADSLEICADLERGCGECMFDKTCDRGEENGGAILKEAAKVIRWQNEQLEEYASTEAENSVRSLGFARDDRGSCARDDRGSCARDDKAMMSADREEDAGKGQAWQMDLYERAIEKFGEEKQIQKAIEEMGELIVELSRALIAGGVRDEHLLANIREELADVCVMTDQLQMIFGDVSDWEMYKLERLERRLVKGL